MVYGYIYKVANQINSKCYIGQAIDPNKRFQKYRTLKCKHQIKLYNALVKYGVSNFTFNIIDEATSKEQLDQMEDDYIIKLNTRIDGYNCKSGGSFGKHSDESKSKMSTSKSGEKHVNFGKPLSEETRRKISEALKGHKVSDETRKKLSENSGRGMLGRHQSEEAKRLISENQRGEKSVHFGKPLSDEHKVNIANALKGRILTEEWKQKISKSHLNLNASLRSEATNS